MSTTPANVPTLCIPRVYPNISESRIRRIFDDLNMGTLDRIDIVSKQSEKGEKFNRVFVHFRRWNDTENAKTARERLLNGKEIKIIYDDPWFWKISVYREPDRKTIAHAPKATIQFDDSDDERPRPPRDERPRPPRDERPRPPRDERPRSPRDERPRHHDERPRHRDERPRHRDERPRHRDERPRPPRDERPRHHDERPRPPRDERPLQDERPPQERRRADSRETHQDVDDEKVEQVPLEYGNIMPPIKTKSKKLVVKQEKEEGED
jgi:hypothetical protein